MTDPLPGPADAGAWIRELEGELEEARSAGLLRSLKVRAPGRGTSLALDGRTLVHFGGNDYLGLGAHPRVVEAAGRALEAYGSGAGASRLVGGGTLEVHLRLEEALARLKGMPAALVFAAGSLANLGLLPALCGEGDLIVLDKACHATLYDGARLSGARWLRFPHQDVARLEALLAREAPSARRSVVCVEGVYSMDGDIAPLPRLKEACRRHGALLVVDEAHSTGVLGPGGGGALEHFGLKPWDGLVLTGTLSKALGSLGGYVAGPAVLRDWLLNRSRAFIYATALPASCAAAALEALAVLREEPGLRARLWSNREALARGLAGLGHPIGSSESPILPVVVGAPARATDLERRLLEAGYHVPAMRPPTVPAGACRLRFSVSAAHEPGQIAGVLRALGPRESGAA